jgi:hypothetical protein
MKQNRKTSAIALSRVGRGLRGRDDEEMHNISLFRVVTMKLPLEYSLIKFYF